MGDVIYINDNKASRPSKSETFSEALTKYEHMISCRNCNGLKFHIVIVPEAVEADVICCDCGVTYAYEE